MHINIMSYAFYTSSIPIELTTAAAAAAIAVILQYTTHDVNMIHF